jgi:hypothetical protein
MSTKPVNDSGYAKAMGRLLVLYTQVDRLIMEACAERLDDAPDADAKAALAKQVRDESRHVAIQRKWMRELGADPTPVIAAEQEEAIRQHFRSLPWIDFLAELYICVEALGSEAVEQVVALADPGTRESLRVPLSDELDHIAFGLGRLKRELARLPEGERRAFLERLPQRIDALSDALEGFGLDLRKMFGAVGANYGELCEVVLLRRDEILNDLCVAMRSVRPSGSASAFSASPEAR